MSADDRIIRLVRIARGVETGGHYNVSKLLWALAYAEEIDASNGAGVPRGEELLGELRTLINELRDGPTSTGLVAALERGLHALQTEQTNTHDEIPMVYVSRTCGDIYLGRRPDYTPCDDDPLDLREFRPSYYLEPLPIPTLIDALRTFPATLTSVMEGLSDEQMTAAPAPGEWSLRELLTHLLVTQGLLLNRARHILSEDNPILQGVSAWMLTDSDGKSAREILDQYVGMRAETVELLTPLQPKDWWRPARHTEFGALTLHEHVSYFARHERSHVPQLMQIVRAVT